MYPPIHLRPYQIQAINALRVSFNAGNKHVILCAPTGAGKTVIFSAMVAAAIAKNKRVLIVTDRIELLTQSGGALSRHNLTPTEITAGNAKPDLTKSLFVGMVETISRRLSKPAYIRWLLSFDLIIFDEAHKQAFNKLFPYIAPHTYVIGATATPHREGNQTSLSEFYTDLIEVTDIPQLIALGYLSQPRTFHYPTDLSQISTTAGDYDANSQAMEFEKQEVFKGVVKNYRRICDGVKTLVFCPTISASKSLLQEFERNGYDCRHLDSEMGQKEREEVLKWYKETPNAILSNVGILTTGFDSPETECVILYRATKSKPLFLQMCGRGGRVTATKSQFYILDFGQNVKKHHLWEAAQNWSLEKKRKKEGVAPVKDCPECGALVHSSIMVCPYCEHEFERKEKKTPKEVELMEIKAVKEEVEPLNFKQMLKLPIPKIVLLVKGGVLKASYVIFNRFTSRARALEFTRLLGYKDGWLWHKCNTHFFTHLTD
jgi:superfamily II DNA or RNA helicase